MNPKSFKEAEELFEAVKGIDSVICPPFVYLQKLGTLGGSVKLGSQDIFWEDSGAFTGEVSPAMVKNLGCQYAIIGHSERRKYFYETDQMVNDKVLASLKAGLTPIVCIGETEQERELGQTEEILEREIAEGLKDIDCSKIIIAYEPIWAIGTGNACDIEEAKKVKDVIKQMTLKDVKVLYGGSAKAENAGGYLNEAGFDGLLVGGASLKPEEFKKICEI